MNKNQNQNQISFDPYAILQIDNRASMQDIKKVYRALTKKYHPDRGGNPEMFRIITQAYQLLTGQIDQSGKHRGIREDNLEVTMKGSLSKDNFSINRFNEEFSTQRKLGVDYVYDVDVSVGHTDRNIGDYRRERDDLETIRPLFNKGTGFDHNVFNRTFERLKEKTESKERSLTAHQPPQALVSQTQIQFSNVNPHGSQMTQFLATGNLTEGFSTLNGDGSFHNPDTMSPDDYNHLSSQPDITKGSTALSKAEMRQRMSSYQSSNYTIPKGGPRPPTGDLQVGNLDPYYQVPDNSNSLLTHDMTHDMTHDNDDNLLITYDEEGDAGMGELINSQVSYLSTPPRPQTTTQRRTHSNQMPSQGFNRIHPNQEYDQVSQTYNNRGIPRTTNQYQRDQSSQYVPTNNPNYQQTNYQQTTYQPQNYQSPNYQSPNYQSPNYQSPNYQPSNYQPSNYQLPDYKPSNSTNGYQQNYDRLQPTPQPQQQPLQQSLQLPLPTPLQPPLPTPLQPPLQQVVHEDQKVKAMESKMDEMMRKMNLQDKLLRKMNNKNKELKEQIKGTGSSRGSNN